MADGPDLSTVDTSLPSDTSGPDLSSVTTAPTVDQMYSNLDRLDPNGRDRIEASDILSTVAPPAFVGASTDQMSESLYGKKMDPPSFVSKLRSTFYETPMLQARKDELAGMQYLGNNDPAVEEQIKEIDAQLSTKKGLGDIPDMIVGGLFNLGYTAYHAAGWLADDIAGTLTANGLGKINFAGRMEGEANKVFGSLVGGTYRAMIDRKFDPTVARTASAALAVGNLALLAIPGGEAAEPIEEAVLQGTLRAGLKGSLERGLGPVAKYLGMDAASARTAGAFGKQGLFALGMSLWNEIIPEASAWLSNRLADTKVALKSLSQMGEDIAKATGANFISAATIPMAREAIRARMQAHINDAFTKMSDRIEQTDAREQAIQQMMVSPLDKRFALEGEGLSKEQIDDLLSGQKTVDQIIEEKIPSDLKEKGIASESLGGVLIPEHMSHQDAVDMAREMADIRLNSILRGLNPDTEQPLLSSFLQDPPPRKNRDAVFDGEVPMDTESVVTDAVNRIGRPFTTAGDVAPGASAGVRTLLGRMPGKVRGAVSPVLFSHDFNAEMVFGGKDNPAYRVVAAHPIRSEMEVRPRAAELSTEVNNWAIEQGLNTPKRVSDYAMKEFMADGITLTKGEILSAAMHFGNEDNKASLLAGQYIDRAAVPDETIRTPIKEETFQKFFAMLTDPEKDLIKRASASLEEAGRARAANHYKLHGEELALVDQYWRKLVYRGGVPSEKDLAVQQERARWMQVIPDESSSIEREDVVKPLHLRNFFQEYPEIMYDTALLEKMGPSLQQAGKIAWDNRITEAVRNRYGQPMVRHFQDNLLRVAGRGMSPQAMENLFNELYRFTITKNLGLNVRTPVKQAFLGLRSIPYTGGGSWRQALMDVIVHPGNTRRLAEKLSMAYRRARSTGGTIELDRMLSDGANFGRHRILRSILNVKARFQKIGMSLTKTGSLFSFKIDTIAAFNATEREFENALRGGRFSDDFRAATGLREQDVAGLGKDAMFAAAGKYADYIIGESHATSYSLQRPGLLNSPVGRLVGIFKSEPMKALEQWTRALMQAKRDPSPSNLRKAVRTTLLYGIAEPIAFYGLDYGWSKLMGQKKEPNLASRIITALAGYWFGVGDFVSGVADRIEYPRGRQQGPAWAQAGGIASDAALNIYTAISKRGVAAEKALHALWDNAATLFFSEMGVPYYFPSNVFRQVKKRLE